jgi:hypothetical protein
MEGRGLWGERQRLFVFASLPAVESLGLSIFIQNNKYQKYLDFLLSLSY